MKKCKRCGVLVSDDTMICPLCRTILTIENESGIQRETGAYPDIRKKKRRFHRAGQIFCFTALVVESVLILINYLTFHALPKYWSVITGAVFAYLIFTMWDLLRRRQGHIRKIYLQLFIILGLLVLIDCSLGFTGWSLEIGLPCVIYGLVAIIIICMSVNFSSWQNYLLMQLAAVLLSAVDLILHFAGFLHHIVLAWVALGLSVLLWSGTMIFGERKAKNELKRKFHI